MSTDKDRDLRRVRGILRAACERIAALEDGRHSALLKEATNIGGYLEATGLSDREAFDALCDAGRRSGTKCNIGKTVLGGINYGKARPRRLPPASADYGPSSSTACRTPPRCRRCNGVSTWQRQELTRGQSVVAWCDSCDCNAVGGLGCPLGTPTMVSPSAFSPEELEAMPIRTSKMRGTCPICRESDILEEHHLAPRAVFNEEANMWPTILVCRSCHERWHAKMSS